MGGSFPRGSSPVCGLPSDPWCPLSLRAAAMEVAAKPGIGSARLSGAAVSLARGGRGVSRQGRLRLNMWLPNIRGQGAVSELQA